MHTLAGDPASIKRQVGLFVHIVSGNRGGFK